MVWRLVHTVRSYVNVTAIFNAILWNCSHSATAIHIFYINHKLQSHRMGIEPIPVWHHTHKCDCNNSSHTIWRVSLTSAQPIFFNRSRIHKKWTVWTNLDSINRLQFRYGAFWAPLRGYMGNNGNVVEVILQSGEYIQKVEYRGGDIFDVLGLYTQTGTDFYRTLILFQ